MVMISMKTQNTKRKKNRPIGVAGLMTLENGIFTIKGGDVVSSLWTEFLRVESAIRFREKKEKAFPQQTGE